MILINHTSIGEMRNLLLLSLIFIFLFFSVEIDCRTPNPYKILGVPENADDEKIKAAFKKRSKKYHPDRNKSDPKAKEKFEKVVNAYELLKDPERRRVYDMTGGGEEPQPYQNSR